MVANLPRVGAVLFLAALAVFVAGCPRNAAPAPGGDAADAPRPPPPAAAKGLHLVLEAEDQVAIALPMAIEDDATAAKGKCVSIPLAVGAARDPKAKEEAPVKEGKGSVSLRFTVPAATTAQVWFRVRWKGVCSNSLIAVFAGQPPLTVGQDQTYDQWHWVKLDGPGLKLAAGEQTVVLREREDGIAVDQVLLTSDRDFVPMDIER